MKVSARKLKALGACSEQVAVFRSFYGNRSVDVTLAECLTHAHDFEWRWGAEKLLDAEQRRGFWVAANEAAREHIIARDIIDGRWSEDLAKLEANIFAGEISPDAYVQRREVLTATRNRQNSVARRKFNRALARAFAKAAGA